VTFVVFIMFYYFLKNIKNRIIKNFEFIFLKTKV
jgi:hypothetical protein